MSRCAVAAGISISLFASSWIPAAASDTTALAAPDTASIPSANTGRFKQPHVPGELIVKVREGASKSGLDAIEQSGMFIVDSGLLASSVKLVRATASTDADATLQAEAALDELARNPAVEYAEPNYLMHTMATPNDPRFSQQWGLENGSGADISAPQAWDRTTGSEDVVIGVIDSGMDITHVDLKENLFKNTGEIAGNNVDDDGNGYIDDVRGWDFYNHDNDPMDAGAHGTHVAGTICAEGDNGLGVVGVLWRCKIMVLQFMGPTGGFTSGAMDALSYAVAKGVRVSNNSWGTNSLSTPLYTTIQNAQAIGHLYVAAAGNNGRDTDLVPLYPAAFDLDNIISVGSIQSNETPAGSSNFGAVSVDLHAPGVGILSTLSDGSYGTMSGTSMASPHVTGAAALLLSANPSLTYGEVRSLLLQTARPAAALAGLSATGGLLDIGAAFDQMTGATPASPSDLIAPVQYYNTVSLAWADNANNESGFEVFRSTDQTSWQSVATVPADSTSYDDISLPAGEYAYQVRAFNATGQSDPSNVATAQVQVPLAITIHVGDLDGERSWLNRTFWQAAVTVEVHDMGDEPVPFATVTGRWSGDGAAYSCVTKNTGRCQISISWLRSNATDVTFTVQNVAADVFTYIPPENHDPDGDSNGTAIRIDQP